MLRFLCGRTDESGVLNGPLLAGVAPGPDLPERFARHARMLHATGRAHDRVSGVCAPVEHIAYAAYRAVAAELGTFDPRMLTGREARLAFWINVFNALSHDAVLAFKVGRSIREVPGFFRRAAYQIGGRRFSAEAIEHGILRDNRPPLRHLPPPFDEKDPRRALSVSPADPRIHFALNCATRSCPPRRTYTAERIDAELDEAAAAFIRGGGVTVERRQVAVSSLFLFYADDFGGPTGIAHWIGRYLTDADEAEAVRDAFARGAVAYQPYDWALSGTDPARDWTVASRRSL